MPLSITKLRANLYKIIDQVILTGVPVEVERHGIRVKLVPQNKKSKLDNLVKHPDAISVDPDSLVHIDWSKEWKGKKLP
jgi:antitoxin (DNA-binding transcriptional repressor) of toxin-antitoxin stability system